MKKVLLLVIVILAITATYLYVSGEVKKGENLSVLSVFPTKDMTTMSCARISSSDKIYCFGGRTVVNQTVSNKIFEVDTKSGAIKQLSVVLPEATFALSCAPNSALGKIYCFGGYTQDYIQYSWNIFEFDPNNQSLTLKNSQLPSGRGGLSCVEDSKSHKIYCFGGFDGNYNTDLKTSGKYGPGYYSNSFIMVDQVFEYDSTSDTIRIMNSKLPFGRDDLSCAENSLTNNIYCFGGNNANKHTDQIIGYDPSRDEIKVEKSVLDIPRAVTSCTQNNQNHKIYCFGGSLSLEVTSNINEITEFEPSDDTLVKRTIVTPEEVGGMSCVGGLSEDIYCMGGFPKATFFKYFRGSFLNQLFYR